jgi:hypothetical protein
MALLFDTLKIYITLLSREANGSSTHMKFCFVFYFVESESLKLNSWTAPNK